MTVNLRRSGGISRRHAVAAGARKLATTPHGGGAGRYRPGGERGAVAVTIGISTGRETGARNFAHWSLCSAICGAGYQVYSYRTIQMPLYEISIILKRVMAPRARSHVLIQRQAGGDPGWTGLRRRVDHVVTRRAVPDRSAFSGQVLRVTPGGNGNVRLDITGTLREMASDAVAVHGASPAFVSGIARRRAPDRHAVLRFCSPVAPPLDRGVAGDLATAENMGGGLTRKIISRRNRRVAPEENVQRVGRIDYQFFRSDVVGMPERIVFRKMVGVASVTGKSFVGRKIMAPFCASGIIGCSTEGGISMALVAGKIPEGVVTGTPDWSPRLEMAVHVTAARRIVEHRGRRLKPSAGGVFVGGREGRAVEMARNLDKSVTMGGCVAVATGMTSVTGGRGCRCVHVVAVIPLETAGPHVAKR